MLWVLIFGAIALAGLVMLVAYGIWLAHKTADVMSELEVLGQRAAELGDLLAGVQMASTDRRELGGDRLPGSTQAAD